MSQLPIVTGDVTLVPVEPAAPKSVVQALTAVLAELPAIGKADTSQQMPYAFRGIETITKHVQPLLAKHGVLIVPNGHVTSVVHSPAMKDGWTDVHMDYEWTIYGPDGDSITARTAGIGRDNSDKGTNKAASQSFKYLLLHLFCIADKADDTDGQSFEHARAEPPPLADGVAVASLIAQLAGIEDQIERAHAKQAFVKEFGHPDRLPADRLDDAAAWVETRLLIIATDAAEAPGPGEPGSGDQS